MKHQAPGRRQAADLLRRRPALGLTAPPSTEAPGVARIDGLRELLHLVDRGLLSEAEFEQQHDRLFRR